MPQSRRASGAGTAPLLSRLAHHAISKKNGSEKIMRSASSVTASRPGCAAYASLIKMALAAKPNCAAAAKSAPAETADLIDDTFAF